MTQLVFRLVCAVAIRRISDCTMVGAACCIRGVAAAVVAGEGRLPLLGAEVGSSGRGPGADILQALGPVQAATAVERYDRADAIAFSGSFRAGAVFAAPVRTARSSTRRPCYGHCR